MTSPGVRMAVLRDIARSPTAASVLRGVYGPYVYPCLYKLVADGLAEQDPLTRAYGATDAGRRLAEEGPGGQRNPLPKRLRKRMGAMEEKKEQPKTSKEAEDCEMDERNEP